VLAKLGDILALGDVVVLSRGSSVGDRRNFGDLGHEYTSGAFAGA
jgi:hypothetical protein